MSNETKVDQTILLSTQVVLVLSPLTGNLQGAATMPFIFIALSTWESIKQHGLWTFYGI